jgi:N-acetylglutamate synthase/N-acetylornithine aminotransferase
LIGGIPVYQNGCFDINQEKELVLNKYLKDNSFDSSITGYPQNDTKVMISVDLANGNEQALVWGSDLSYDYVKENADYRS